VGDIGLKKLCNNDVRIIKLEPMKVVSFQAISNSPEYDALDILTVWRNKNEITNTARRFGFNNPMPEEGKNSYGYEIWEMIDEGLSDYSGVIVKQFEGGLYAVVKAIAGDPYIDIPLRWQQLYEWVNESEYKIGEHQWLEEHLAVIDGKSDLLLDLFFPIEK